MGGGGGGQQSTTKQGIDPILQPFVSYGLGEAQRLYQSETPSFFPGQTFVGPSEATTGAIQSATQRAMAGSPLLSAAQQQQQGVVSGQYLGANPYFQAALQPAAQAATQQYYDAMAGLGSRASTAGRYGSEAMARQEDRAALALANALSGQAGKLAYENYATERGRQEAAATQAPTLAAADYMDINQLLKAGQLGEQYQGRALEDEMARFEFEQNKPYAKLSTFLSSVYGAPQGSVTQTTSGGKIVCTAMCKAYGFGSFRQKIWLEHSKNMHPAFQVGYHAIFLPVVEYAYNGELTLGKKLTRKVAEHIARHRTADIWKRKRGRFDLLGTVYRGIIEPVCFAVGVLKMHRLEAV
jgi:hypothetical protein